jgi:ketosteroid isomerase-like protein
MRPAALLLLAAAAALACTPAADNTAAARLAIDAANANWPRLTANGHADSIAEFYDDSAVVFPPNMPAVRGKEAIRAFFAEMNELRPTLTLRAESVWGAGTWALELGRWTFAWPAGATRPPGVPAADSGKYLVRWVQHNGQWLMAEDLWNSDLPTPGAPAQ